MGLARRYILECDLERTSGVTTVFESVQYDLTDSFSGTSIFDTGSTFSYNSITLIELGELSDVNYQLRVTDFFSYVSQFIYTYTLTGITELISEGQYDELFCITPTTTTTTTTVAPTTTTTTTSGITTTTTTVAPTTTTTTTAPSFTGEVFIEWDGSEFTLGDETLRNFLIKINDTSGAPTQVTSLPAGVSGFTYTVSYTLVNGGNTSTPFRSAIDLFENDGTLFNVDVSVGTDITGGFNLKINSNGANLESNGTLAARNTTTTINITDADVVFTNGSTSPLGFSAFNFFSVTDS